MTSGAASLAIVHELSDPENPTARVCSAFQVGDVVLGDPTALDDSLGLLHGVDALLRHQGQRRDDRLFSLPLERLQRHLEVGLIVYADSGLEAGRDWQRYLRFVAAPREAAAFEGWSVFVVENGQLGRLLWKRPGDPTVAQAFIEAGELDAVLRRFRSELTSSLSTRRPPPKSGERLRASRRDVGRAGRQ